MGNVNLCQQPDYSISCVGCCGVGMYETREELIEAIRLNTEEFNAFMRGNPSKADKDSYFNRGREIDRESGLCSLLVFLNNEETQVGCSGHPLLQGTDYRVKFNLCHSSYICSYTIEFEELSAEERKKKLEELSLKFNGDWVSLSICMENESL